MSITKTMRYYTRPFSQDPAEGSPGGLWVALESLTGDASGGKRQLNWNVSTPDAPNLLFYSLEDLEVEDTGAETRSAMIIRGLDPSPFADQGSFTRNYALNMLDITAQVGFGLAAFRLGTTESRPRLFLGQSNANIATSNQISFDIANVDGEQFFVRASGYWWWPGASNAMFGFRRPPDGLYGT